MSSAVGIAEKMRLQVLPLKANPNVVLDLFDWQSLISRIKRQLQNFHLPVYVPSEVYTSKYIHGVVY